MRWPTALALAGALVAAEPLPIVGLSHVGIRVSSLESSLRFYTGLLGFPVAFRSAGNDGRAAIVVLQINDNQYLELLPGLPADQPLRVTHVSLETTDAARLRLLLLARGLAPGDLREGRDGNLNFRLPDSERNTLEFTEYRPTSNHTITRGQNAAVPRISNRLMQTAVLVERKHLGDILAFYKTKLGFDETWRGLDDRGLLRWVNLKMPGVRGDALEAVLLDRAPAPAHLGTLLHVSFEVPNIAAAAGELRRRGLADLARHQPRLGRDQRRHLDLLDPDGTRVELVESRPTNGPRTVSSEAQGPRAKAVKGFPLVPSSMGLWPY
jgi:lactoylglutathione lyase